ncbi:Ectoine hydroxylase-related dioxygenase, phytanoyl-CoA dioxygenase (PhyH) family [Rhizobiales bacterium GAS113]|nr:Ectoine hydroxylase-related dioxygenase, phytanoyl-CoA dioxygenase (PhyH) family [Rhizobiales bacterium GAS113]
MSVVRYGVREQVGGVSEVDRAVEQLRLLGYAIVDGGYSAADLARFSAAFDGVHDAVLSKYGRQALAEIDEHNTIRAPMSLDMTFIEIARNPDVLGVCQRLIGEVYYLNQQNGIVNPARGERYNQQAYHRDLPYQHFVSSRPLAINALFCLDAFTVNNGATFVVPASHKQEAFPSDRIVEGSRVQIEAPAGSFIILDCMLYHSGGVNRTNMPRRAVNHVYSIPLLKQQLSLPQILGPDFATDPAPRNFLGYDFEVPDSIERYYENRRAKYVG